MSIMCITKYMLHRPKLDYLLHDRTKKHFNPILDLISTTSSPQESKRISSATRKLNHKDTKLFH